MTYKQEIIREKYTSSSSSANTGHCCYWHAPRAAPSSEKSSSRTTRFTQQWRRLSEGVPSGIKKKRNALPPSGSLVTVSSAVYSHTTTNTNLEEQPSPKSSTRPKRRLNIVYSSWLTLWSTLYYATNLNKNLVPVAFMLFFLSESYFLFIY